MASTRTHPVWRCRGSGCTVKPGQQWIGRPECRECDERHRGEMAVLTSSQTAPSLGLRAGCPRWSAATREHRRQGISYRTRVVRQLCVAAVGVTLLGVLFFAASAHAQSAVCNATSKSSALATDSLRITPEELRPAPPPPTKADQDKPARNAADFPTCPAEAAALLVPTTRAQTSQSRHRPGIGGVRRHREVKGRSAHAVYCHGDATTTRGNLRYVANGQAICSSPIELLADMNCVELWATGGYWTRLSCGDWRTLYGVSSVVGWSHGRDCTEGRTYRAATVVSALHHGLAQTDTGYAPSHTCIRT